ncbi:MAG: hypothetical protein KAG96_07580 [Ichthyobacteriaceae bacterium]|nr:hypothetical protein [Ichthyobacteriaceae bacterium]
MENIFSEFNNQQYKQWKNLANLELNGKAFNDILTWHIPEGINIPAYQNAENKKTLDFHLNTNNNLAIGKEFTISKNKNSLDILDLILKEDFSDIKINIPENYNLSLLLSLKNINSKNIHFEFQHFLQSDIETILLIANQNSNRKIYLNIDIFTNLIFTGNWFQNEEKDIELIKTLAQINADNVIPFAVNTSSYQNAGANIIQQIAYTLAICTEYANILGANFFNKVQYLSSFGYNHYLEVSKLTVTDVLLEEIKIKYKAKSKNIYCGEPSKRNKTLYDAYANIIRTSSENTTAILAGVNTIFGYNFDCTYNAPNTTSGNIAYNQLKIVKNRLTDNNNKSLSENYYLGFIKHELLDKSLELFKKIEKRGGFLSLIKKDIIQNKIIESSIREIDFIACNKLNFISINLPSIELKKMNDLIRKYPFVKFNNHKTLYKKLNESRISEKTEKAKLIIE